jgi:hypothetical protein
LFKLAFAIAVGVKFCKMKTSHGCTIYDKSFSTGLP